MVSGPMISRPTGTGQQTGAVPQASGEESRRHSYALATAAYNEEKLIGRVIQSIVDQTVRPEKWVIVNDGSTDRTAEIVQSYAAKYPFIEMFTITEEHPRNLTAQVHAINRGFSMLKGLSCEFIGNLDADVTLEPNYFENLLEKFKADPQLGLAGGFIYEEQEGIFQNRGTNVISSVAHAVQLFRRECLLELGGYRPFTWAGADWYAEVTLRMKGWNVYSVPELKAFHHRPTGGGFGQWRYSYRGGIMARYMGSHPVFECFKTFRRIGRNPLGALVRFSGFVSAFIRREPLQVPDEFARYLQQEQMERLRAEILGTVGFRTKSASARLKTPGGSEKVNSQCH